MPVDGGSVSNPLLPTSIEYAFALTFALGVICTVIAARRASQGVMRPSGAVKVFLLNFLPIAGPVAAASGIAWHYQRCTRSKRID